MAEVAPFLVLVGALGVVGVAAGILIARRIDTWEVARNDVTDRTDGTDAAPRSDQEPDT